MGPSSVIGLCVFAFLAIAVEAQGKDSKLEKLFQGYDKRVRPNYGGRPVKVTAQVYTERMDVRDRDLDMSLTIYLRMSWKDPRFVGKIASQITLSSGSADLVWKPDYYFSNEKRTYGNEAQASNRYVRIYSNGDVFYSERIALDVSCPMKFHKLPFDTQHCGLVIESYGHTTNDIVLEWKEDAPIRISDKVSPGHFHLEDSSTAKCDKTYSTGTFPCIKVDLQLDRDLAFYTNLIYIPAIFVIIAAWIITLVDKTHAAARATVGIMCVLILVVLYTTSRHALPDTSYFTAIDTWMLMSYVLVTIPILEFCLIHILAKQKLGIVVRILEMVTRILLPIVFVLFCFIYFLGN